MREVHGEIAGPVSLEEDSAVRGTIVGGATVRSGVVLVLHGLVTGDLVIEAKARAVIHGTVNGTIVNDGGRVEIFGTADATFDRSPQAVTVIDPVARVRTRK